MLNQRQTQILLELFENENTFIKSQVFANKYDCSIRTIQNDIKVIKQELEDNNYLEFQSKTQKGNRIVILDNNEFQRQKESYYLHFSNASKNIQDERNYEILQILFQQHHSISLFDLEEKLYVSRSTLYNDLKRTEQTLANYNLVLLRNANRITIDGSEINKRACISELNIFEADDNQLLTQIKNIIIDTFIQEKKSVSDVMVSNMIILLNVTIQRLRNCFLILPYDLQITEDLQPEYQIAENIFKRISETFNVNASKEEISYLAIYMKGQGNFSNSVISKDMDDFILNTLTSIRDIFGIDLTDNLNLRINLALHCAPLFIRIKYDMQMKKNFSDNIRVSYPQGFDLAVFFSSKLQELFHKKVADEETALIAIHLYSALSEQQKSEGAKVVTVISSMRWSENVLLRQTLYRWFPRQIVELNFVTPNEMTHEILESDNVILTTEKGEYFDKGVALYVDPFPNKNDYLNIKLALEGFASIESITDMYSKDLFFHFRKTTNTDMLEKMCSKVEEKYEITNLLDSVLEREHMRSTYLGNSFASPHPISPVSTNTFVSVGVCDQPVVWDEDGHKVNVVILIGIGKNNYTAFHLWNYLSKVFMDTQFVEKLLANPTYDKFIEMIKDTLSDVEY